MSVVLATFFPLMLKDNEAARVRMIDGGVKLPTPLRRVYPARPLLPALVFR